MIQEPPEHTSRQASEPIPAPSISVIVCTFNRADQLKRALDSIFEQSPRSRDGRNLKYEVILVDDGSTDSTPQVCEELLRTNPNFLYLRHSQNKGLAASRNSGFGLSSGDFILFMDDDCVADKAWIENLFAALSEDELVAGSIQSPARPFFLLAHNFSQFYPFFPESKKGKQNFIAGANFGARRETLRKIGPFNESLRCAEDFEFVIRARKLGIPPMFAPNALVTHIPKRHSFKSFIAYSAKHASQTIRIRRDYAAFLKTPAILRSPLTLVLLSPFIAFAVTCRIFVNNPNLIDYAFLAPFVFASKVAWCMGAARGLINRKSNS